MPSKKKKYNARFPAGRIKKIMQSDEEIGKVAQAVPVIICCSHIPRTLELFVESLLTKTLRITNSRNAKTLSTSHMKQCIMSEQRFDFLRELVKNIPDISLADEAANYIDEDGHSSPEDVYPDSDTPFDLSMPSTSGRLSNRTPAASNNGVSDALKQVHYQYKQRMQQLHNGTNEKEPKQRARQRSAANTSVITHTALVNQAGGYVQPLRLMRSDSSPANSAQHSMWHVAHPVPQSHNHPQKRLKHQSQSVPCSNIAGITNSDNNHKSNNCSSLKRQKSDFVQQQTPKPAETQPHPQPQPHSQAHTAIPAPIFSYDLCNKPIVKIDYSNLPLTTETSIDTTNVSACSATNLPMSAPVTSAGFDFNAAPIINIDLSNIVTNMSATTMAATNITPAIATISIGAIPTTATQTTELTERASTSASNATLASTCTIPPSITPTPDIKAKAPIDTPTVGAATKASTAPSVAYKNSNSIFELDEDYDNI